MIQDKEENLALSKGIETATDNLKLKLYPMRWIILLLFILYAASSSMQWFQYSIIINIVSKYYGVSEIAVDWTSVISMVLYAPLMLPACYFIEKWVS